MVCLNLDLLILAYGFGSPYLQRLIGFEVLALAKPGGSSFPRKVAVYVEADKC